MSRFAEWTIYESPLGPLTVAGGPGGIARLYFPGGSPHLDAAAGRPMGEALQRLIWDRLQQIPYGSTISYGELARQIEVAAFPEGLEPYQRVRAAAAAVGRTPTPILVPCHRVIGADGSLTGYGGGLERKRALLDLERGATPASQPTRGDGPGQLALL